MATENNELMPGSIPAAKKTCIFKKINALTYINILLFCGMVTLYALHFAGVGFAGRKPTNQQQAGTEIPGIDASARIAYIDSELLMENYELAKKLRADFEAERTRMENDLSRRQRNFQAEVEQFQRDVQSGRANLELAQAKEQELMQKQQELIQLNETFTNRLMQKEVEMNRELHNKLSEFLKRYNVEHGFDYILGFSPGGGILYANTQLEITDDVLIKLNAEYLAEQEAGN